MSAKMHLQSTRSVCRVHQPFPMKWQPSNHPLVCCQIGTQWDWTWTSGTSRCRPPHSVCLGWTTPGAHIMNNTEHWTTPEKHRDQTALNNTSYKTEQICSNDPNLPYLQDFSAWTRQSTEQQLTKDQGHKKEFSNTWKNTWIILKYWTTLNKIPESQQSTN